MTETSGKSGTKHMAIDMPCTKKNIVRARLKVLKFAEEHGFADDAQDISLAVEEAVKNILQHACPVDRSMHIKLESNSKELSIEVMDIGTGFDVESLKGGTTEPMRLSGRGLTLIEGLMDKVTITSDQEGTVVRMEKRRTAA